MATAHHATSSNKPAIDPDHNEAVLTLMDEYVYGSGPLGVMVPEIRHCGDESPYLAFFASSPFAPVVRKDRFDDYNDPDVDEPEFFTETRYQHDDTHEFLARLAPYLDESLFICSLAHTKLRYTSARFFGVSDGTITDIRVGSDSGFSVDTVHIEELIAANGLAAPA